MFIYIIFKVIFGAIGSLLKMDMKKGFVVFELLVIVLYVSLLYYDFLQLNIGLLLWFFL